MTFRVATLDDARAADWDAYVQVAPGATFFHLAGWRNVLQRAFGHRAHFLYAERDGQIVGVLPLAEVKSLLFGHSLSSLPFCVYGGIVADSPEVAAGLRQAACDLAEQMGVRSQSQYKQEYLADLFTADTIYGTGELRNDAGVKIAVPS